MQSNDVPRTAKVEPQVTDAKEEGKVPKSACKDQRRIYIVVKDQSDKAIGFDIKKSSTFVNVLKHVFKSYCGKRDLDYDSIRFIFDGERLLESDTPEQRGMEDDDTIDAMTMNVGGFAPDNAYC